MATIRPPSAGATEDVLAGLSGVLAQLVAARSFECVRELVGVAACRLAGAGGASVALHDEVSGNDAGAGSPATGRGLVVPIGTPEPLGEIVIHWADSHAPTEREAQAAQMLATAAAATLERLRLRERLAWVTYENARLAREVEQHRTTEQGLRELCERDPLTGLLNRRAWDRALAGALRQRRQPVYIALIDLDHFKAFNDDRGHPAGDELLRAAASCWRAALRAGDILARYGGDEFAVLLTGGESERAIEIAERLRMATIDDRTASIGVARWDGSETGASLTARADAALYDAKRGGRNRVVLSAGS